MFPIPAEFNDVFLEIAKPILQKYFFSFVNIYCGELQENVTDSTLYDLPQIISILSDIFETITKRQNNQLIKTLGPEEIKSHSNTKDEHPPIWGPGLKEPPGGPEYRNRYNKYE